MHDDDLHALAHRFDRDLAELQQCDADLPLDDGISARQADLRQRVGEQQRALEDAGLLPPRQSWWVQLTVASCNLHDYTAAEAASPERGAQREVLRSLGADVLCLQEIRHRTDDPADPGPAAVLDELCAELGMVGRVAWARSGHHTAVAWRPERADLIEFRDHRHWPWHHALGIARLDVGARQDLRVASGHFSPWSPDQRAHEAQLLGAVVPGGSEWMIAGLDLNSPSTAAPEPYQDQDPGGRHQLSQRIHSDMWPATSDVAPVDRRAAALLDRHRLHDLADRAGQHDLVTSGHHPDDPHGPRRVDCLRTTPALVARTTGVRVHDTFDARAASDHLPISTVVTVPWRPAVDFAGGRGRATITE